MTTNLLSCSKTAFLCLRIRKTGEGSALNPTVKRHNGTAWELVGIGAISADRAVGVGIAIDSG